MPTWWSILVECKAPAKAKPLDATDERFDLLLDDLASHDGVVSGGGHTYAIRMSVKADDVLSAVLQGRETAWKAAVGVGLPEWPIVRLDTMTHDLLDEELEESPMPKLVGASELVDVLGVTRQRVRELRQRPDFPTPLVELAAGPVWDRAAIDAWQEHWDRRPGRRPAQKASQNRGRRVTAGS